MLLLCHTNSCHIPCTCRRSLLHHAGHEFLSVGLTPCALNTAAAAIGTKFTIPFSVSDSSSPLLQASITRTVVIVSPCSSGSLLHTLDLHNPALSMTQLVGTPQACICCSGHFTMGVTTSSKQSMKTKGVLLVALLLVLLLLVGLCSSGLCSSGLCLLGCCEHCHTKL